MRQVAERMLWIGNSGDLRDARKILDAGIEAIVELADNEPFAIIPRDLIRCRFPLSDGGNNPAWLLRLAAQTVATLIGKKIPAFVCCSCGMNRSVCIAAASVSLSDGCPLSEAIMHVIGTGPADVSPRLFAELQEALINS